MQLTEKLRAQIEEQTFTFDGVRIPVTVSAGIADLEEYIHRSEHDPTTGDVRIFDFIKLSDDRLYAAKRLGRNVAVGD